MDSRKERRGICGQKGTSNVLRIKWQAASGSVCGTLPMPVVKKGGITMDIRYYTMGLSALRPWEDVRSHLAIPRERCPLSP